MSYAFTRRPQTYLSHLSHHLTTPLYQHTPLAVPAAHIPSAYLLTPSHAFPAASAAAAC